MDIEKYDEKNLDPVYYLALDGDVLAAIKKLKAIDVEKLNPREKRTRQKYLERFSDNESALRPRGKIFIEKLKSAYLSYWDKVLLQKLNQEEGGRYLFEQLAPIVQQLGMTLGSFSEKEYVRVAAFLESQLREDGYFAKIGRVKPHLNLMAWKTQTNSKYKVNLGDGLVQEVDVVFMDDFVVLGWAAYATFEKLHVGGWVEESSIHCVVSKYDLDSENFHVSFLAHEARHFADRRNYPNLLSLDLEYRAKLTELVLANETMESLLKRFFLEQKDNPENPHSYASYLMMKALSSNLGKTLNLESIPSIDKDSIRKYADELLKTHTSQLNSETESVLI